MDGSIQFVWEMSGDDTVPEGHVSTTTDFDSFSVHMYAILCYSMSQTYTKCMMSCFTAHALGPFDPSKPWQRVV